MSCALRCCLGWLCVAAGVALLASGVRAAGSQPPVESKAGKQGVQPPPKFDAEVLQLFATDARTKLGPGEPGGMRPPAAAAPGATPGGAPPAGDLFEGGFTWSKLISPDSLEAEVKGQVPFAANAVKTITGFKGKGREQAQTSFTVLAVLFGVIAQYDGDVRWKKDAPGLEKSFSQAGFNCKTSSDAAFKGSQKCSQDLAELVRGGTVDLPKGDASVPWSDLVNRPALMRRMEEARVGGNVSKWLSTKGEFKKNKDALLREAQMLAVISEVIKGKGFESGDDEAYQKYATALQVQCMVMIEAITTDQQDKAQSTFAQVSKACDACHGDFK